MADSWVRPPMVRLESSSLVLEERPRTPLQRALHAIPKVRVSLVSDDLGEQSAPGSPLVEQSAMSESSLSMRSRRRRLSIVIQRRNRSVQHTLSVDLRAALLLLLVCMFLPVMGLRAGMGTSMNRASVHGARQALASPMERAIARGAPLRSRLGLLDACVRAERELFLPEQRGVLSPLSTATCSLAFPVAFDEARRASGRRASDVHMSLFDDDDDERIPDPWLIRLQQAHARADEDRAASVGELSTELSTADVAEGAMGVTHTRIPALIPATASQRAGTWMGTDDASRRRALASADRAGASLWQRGWRIV